MKAAAPEASPAQTRQGAERLLRRLLHSGSLHGFPRDPKLLDTLLAIVATTLIRRRPYSEQGINRVLVAWLATVRADLDHVTLRRRMVDRGFLRRTTNGSRYFMDYGCVAGILGDPAVEVDAGGILEEILREREARKRAWGKD